MEFKNGYRGIKRIFNGEILQLLTTLAILVMTVLVVFEFVKAKKVATYIAIAGLVGFVGLLMYLSGLRKAGKDCKYFKAALAFIWFGILCSIFSAGIELLEGELSWAVYGKGAAKVLQNVFQLLVVVKVIQGIKYFAEQKENEKVLKSCKTLKTLITILYTLIILLGVGNFALDIMTETEGSLITLIEIAVNVIGIVQYVAYLVLLSNAKKMLKE